jgi:hypothetical protein
MGGFRDFGFLAELARQVSGSPEEPGSSVQHHDCKRLAASKASANRGGWSGLGGRAAMSGSLAFARLNTKYLLDRGEFLGRFIEDQNSPIADVVDPGVQPNRTGGDAGSHCWMGPQMLELQEDVLFYEGSRHVVARGVWIFGQDHSQCRIGVPQPALDGGHGRE